MSRDARPACPASGMLPGHRMAAPHAQDQRDEEPAAEASAEPTSELSGWGRCPVVRAEERVSEDLAEACRGTILTRGLGRSYGDASLPPPGAGPVAGSRLADRVLRFDPEAAVLRAEAGASLRTLDDLLWPRGFSVPVHPGTEFVTLGGMVASDVHGKNHHVAGTIGRHVRALRMLLADGRDLEVTREREPELFAATLGGLGLTGHILEVEIALERIPTPFILCETEPFPDLRSLVAALREASARWPFTVGWADGLRRSGRGILVRGRWAEPAEAPATGRLGPRYSLAVPFVMPDRLLGRAAMHLVNTLYFHKHGRGVRRRVVAPRPFFFPLDAILHWNRAYGPKGFVQHQSVLPDPLDVARLEQIFDLLARRGGSFLTVVKDCGPEGEGLISFPRPGVSVALDLPMRGASTQALVDALNEIVLEARGRIYLTKDALSRPEHFRAMEPRLERFRAARERFDPQGRLRSALSMRVLGDPA